MPKITAPSLPLSALFAITKPSGPSSMAIVNDLKMLIATSRLFVDAEAAAANAENSKNAHGTSQNKGHHRRRGNKKERRGADIKIGQGGTLDPLADGVLVIAVGKATKRLGEFLDCVKEYRTTCLLGCETDTYDSEGARVRKAPWRHVTRAAVEAALSQFRGNIEQTPPIFSALKMDGKPLYEYARNGIPLPRPIARRSVTVHSLSLTRWIDKHDYRWPEKSLTDEQREKLAAALRGKEMPEDAEIKDSDDTQPEIDKEESGAGEETEVPPAFVLSMRVSGGTYVRCIAHDLAHAVGSAGHVVTLTRAQQGRFALRPEDDVLAEKPDNSEGTQISASKSSDEERRYAIPWDIFSRALADGVNGAAQEEPDADGWREWERQVIANMEVVEGKEDKVSQKNPKNDKETQRPVEEETV